MKKLFISIIAIFFLGSVYGQNLSSNDSSGISSERSGLSNIDKSLQLVVVVDSMHVKIDDFNKYDIKPEWIESVSILKDEKSKKIWGNENGVAFLYIKEKYGKKVLKEIRK